MPGCRRSTLFGSASVSIRVGCAGTPPKRSNWPAAHRPAGRSGRSSPPACTLVWWLVGRKCRTRRTGAKSKTSPTSSTQDDISLSADSRLRALPRGDTAKDATIADEKESYRIARYARKFVVTEEDIIDDRLGAIMRMPEEMGKAARRLRPDLVYALLLANAALADTGAVQQHRRHDGRRARQPDHGCLGSHRDQSVHRRDGQIPNAGRHGVEHPAEVPDRPLGAPVDSEGTVDERPRKRTLPPPPPRLRAFYYPINVIAGENLSLRVDDRIGAAGVVDPTTNQARTGLDTNWFLSAGGPRTVRVAYRRGTGRQPIMRSFVLDKGQWGLGWDINLDIGAKALDYRGLHKSAGTG